MNRLLHLFLIAVLSGLPLTAAPAFCAEPSEPVVRIRILDDVDSVTLDSKSTYTVTAAGSTKVLQEGSYFPVKVAPVESGLMVGKKSVAEPAVTICPDDGADIYVGKKRFRGSVDIIKKDDLKLTVINRVPVEVYLYSVLRHEVSPHWPPESLKAQAIVARTFALYQARINRSRQYDMTSDIYSQVYGGSASEKWTTTRAVKLTKGKVLAYKGDIFPAYYHATCAGWTEDASNLWNIDIPPLDGAECGFCYHSPHYRWTCEITPREMGKKLRAEGQDIGEVVSVGVVSRNRSRRVEKLDIRDDKGKTVTMSAKDFRHMFGPNSIRSTNFYIVTTGGFFLVEGFGWGHGVGLCQWGAYKMAKEGATAEEILRRYYPGASIMTADKVKDKL
ncbi:MAG: SpoIID/LytB domain-containing protein [Candidatus Omnitrophica bacterium]|nr:SpoIID/LytB domain-containing protein [Candidatus Omnitrophota bacterium]